MPTDMDLKKIKRKIKNMKEIARELNNTYEDFPAIKRNTTRILASIKMLEINISDIADL